MICQSAAKLREQSLWRFRD